MGKVDNKNQNKVSLLHSIKTKIVLLVIVVIIATAGINLLVSVPLIKKNFTTLTQNYMKDMATLVGETIETEIGYLGAEAVLTPEELAKVAKDIKVSGMDSSYAYIVSADGTMMYHPTPEKIGQPVENDAVKSLLAEIAKGNRPEPDVITYLFKGVAKYASYYIGSNMDYIVIVTADESEALSSVSMMMQRTLGGSAAALVFYSIIGFLIAAIIVKPIEKATKMIVKISELDFTDRENLQASLNRRKDETGVMAKAIGTLRKELADVIRSITGQSVELHDASNAMNNSAYETSQSVDQFEKAINEIAQGATSQAQETQTATENVILMGNMIEETNNEVEKLRNNARSMRDSGDKALNILAELNNINQKTKEAIQTIYEQTNMTNESALKIKEATDIITDIAEETNLLSLNASIEAARAGEQGRGFAVVASQIQKLAEQSNDSARQIADIINLLITDSEKTVETMEDVKAVIEQQNEHVINTGKAFMEVKTGIDSSVESVREITAKTKQLDDARVKVVDVVQNLTAIAEENAASTEETSASASEVGAIMGTISDNAQQLNTIADELKNSIKQFITD
ncbi:MAG: methyl-accepting chemotaxis protein [Lachnospiraceae bacterium]|nr:methyl-accepting chemotaxis protein [Lachnospiraceae bacterium]MDY5869728.1 methyl-accepting chemotaxis protein [Lachnospiraceae bacterium]